MAFRSASRGYKLRTLCQSVTFPVGGCFITVCGRLPIFHKSIQPGGVKLIRWQKTLAAVAFGVVSFLFLNGVSANEKSKSANVKNIKAVTFNKDVAPILYEKCATCHRSGEAAPFSVLSYKEVRPWARSIKEKVINREMPPWHADPHTGKWANDRRLTEQQIQTIANWVDQGAGEGNPKDLPLRQLSLQAGILANRIS